MRQDQVKIFSFRSESLKNNPLGDANTRQVPVYLPPSYKKSKKRYPVAYFLSGFAGSGQAMLNYSPFEPSLPERMEGLIQKQEIPEMIAVMPDCMTRVYGSQFVNSAAIGNYEDYILELVGYIDKKLRTVAESNSRIIIGKSSGGFGSLMLGMKHPDVFGNLACHSGDMYFEYCYKTDIPKAYQVLQHYQSLKSFYNYLSKQPKIPPRTFSALNIIGMSAAYSPNAENPDGFDLPFEWETGQLREDIWKRWLAYDPVEIVAQWKKNLKKLNCIFVDCGDRDEHFLYVGSRILTRKLRQMKVKHHYEEFDDGHRGLNYRYDRSLPLVSKHLMENEK